MRIAKTLEDQDVTDTILQLEAIGELFNVNFVISVSVNDDTISESLKDKVILSL